MPGTKQELIDLIQAQIRQEKSASRFQQGGVSRHVHNGSDSPRVSEADLLPKTKILGDITMQTNGRVYNFSLPSAPKSVRFLGAATGSGPKRAMIVGEAQLGPSFEFSADTANSVTVGTQNLNIIQGSTQFIQSSGPSFSVNTSENYIASLTSDSRLEVISFDSTSVQIRCLLGSGWSQFVGTFIFT